jgi:ribosome silencing factor RsfS/YbeB/iojap
LHAEEATIARTPKAPEGPSAGTAETPKPRRAPAKRTVPKARSAGDEAERPARPKRAPAAAKPPAKPAAPRGTVAPRSTKAKAPAKPEGAIAAASAAGPGAAPKPRRAKREKVTPDRLELLVAAARQSLEDDKAEDLVVLDVTDKASFADRMIIATGQVERQIQAMATHVEQALEKLGLKLRRDSIQGSPDWVLIDCGDLIVHLFRPEAREMYALERMWGPDSPAAEG